MTILRGTISQTASMDGGRRIGFGFTPVGARHVYLSASEMHEGTALGLLVRNAAEMGDLVEIQVEPSELRLGAPEGHVVAIRTVEHAGIARPLAKAA